MNYLPQIKKHLKDSGITTPDIKINNLPDTPVALILLRDTGEVEPDINFSAKGIEDRTFQVFVRHDNYETAVALCASIRSALHGRIAHTEGAFYFYNMATISGFQPITNEIGHYEFSGNFRTKLRAN